MNHATERRNRLIEAHWQDADRWARAAARDKNVDEDDASSAAAETIIAAAEKFDDAGDASFKTYLRRAIENAVVSLSRSKSRYAAHVVNQSDISPDAWDVAAPPPENFLESDEISRQTPARTAWNVLGRQHRRVLAAIARRESREQSAERFGCPVHTIDRLRSAARQTFKKEIERASRNQREELADDRRGVPCAGDQPVDVVPPVKRRPPQGDQDRPRPAIQEERDREIVAVRHGGDAALSA